MHSDSVSTNWVPVTYFDKYNELNGSYLSIVGTKFVLNDIYPFWWDSPYAGEEFQNYRLNYLNDRLSLCRTKIDSLNLLGDTTEFWFAPQSFQSQSDGWRYPIASEFACMTYMGLTWGCKGVVYWFYDNSNMGDYFGILDHNHNPTPLYNQIKNMIGPYIKAIDSVYMGLTWDNAYPCTLGMVNSGPLIHSISAQSNTPDPNPDLGWFHIGEYSNPSEPGVTYFMLVNRACSQGPDTSAEAPSVTAVVRLDPEAIGSDYALIIDIAKSIDHDTTDHTWTAVPETTYSAVLDSTIPFTVMLKAGEGRLFKVVASNKSIEFLPSHSQTSR
jgi:hypothetical protein